MSDQGHWRYKTSAGTFYIRPLGDRYNLLFQDDFLESYWSPAQAAWNLAGGHTTSRRFDTSRLGIPSDLSAWEFVET